MNIYNSNIPLTECDKERLHEIGAIQDEGYLMAVKVDESRVVRIVSISENLLNVAWSDEISDAAQILDKEISSFFGRNVATIIGNLVLRFEIICHTANSMNAVRNFALLSINSAQLVVKESLLCCSVVGCINKDVYLLEFEEVLKPVGDSIPNHQILQSGDIVGRIRAGDSPESVTTTFCDAIMEILTDYDRGMVYKFEDDLSGNVIHENVRNNITLQSSYLNLRFPAGDIPLPARLLYIKSGLRFIANVDGVDSRMLSAEWNETLDLSMSCLRSCSKVHLQYLRNMGVKASLSIPIVINDGLWGLYVLHSYRKATKPNVEERIMLEMVASISAMRVDAFQREKNSKRKLDMSSIMLNLQSFKSIHEFLQMKQIDLLNVLDAHAIAIFEGEEERVLFGDESIAPTLEGYRVLIERCKTNSIISLSSFREGLSGTGAGVIFSKHPNVCIAIIRRSEISDVYWAGNPDKNVNVAANERLQPRSSFEIFFERARHHSKLWNEVDIELAQYFFERLTNYLHSQLLSTFRLSLDQSNSECIQAIEAAKEHYEFFAHMSHELRTPFHGVISSLQILDSGGSSISHDEQKEIVESALECGKTMLRTLDDILVIAKHKNNVETVRSPVNIWKLISSSRKMMGPIAENKGVSFQADLLRSDESKIIGLDANLDQQDLYWKSIVVLSDEVRIIQIANNLTNNAIKFTDPGGSVSLRAHLLKKENVELLWDNVCKKYVNSFQSIIDKNDVAELNNLNLTEVLWYVIEIEDTGCGVSFEDMKTMFNAYKQVSSGVKKTYQGTGLGLHICRLHAELMHGSLRVASSPDKGTLFLCSLPVTLLKESKLDPIKDASAIIIESSAASSLVKENSFNSKIIVPSKVRKNAVFLVVDDSMVNLRLTKRKINMTLEDNALVKFAMDGLQAIEFVEKAISEFKYSDLVGIFMDYHMPKCSGLQAIVEIRKLERKYQALPVYIIAFTADVSETTTHELINAGANEVLPKPTPNGKMEDICVRLLHS
jgi:light-regulated signal transduction histidine kinase (bacteriophytochrome)/CheY-like chemotaxis protein